MPAVYSATTRTRPLGKKLTNQSVTWEQRMTIFFSNKPITLKNTSNWKPNKEPSVASLSGNFAICWLLSFDLNFSALFNGIAGLVSAKWIFKLKFSSKICDYGISPSRTSSLRVYVTQRSWYIVLMYSCQTDRSYVAVPESDQSIVLSLCFDHKNSYSSAIWALTEIIYKLRLQTWQSNACCKKTLINDLTFRMPQHTFSEVKSYCIISKRHFWGCMLRHTKRCCAFD